MAFDLSDCQFHGPALPDPFVKFELERELNRLRLLPKTTGNEARQLKEQWEVYLRKLRALAASGGALRVFHHVVEPLLPLLGYARYETSDQVQTREDREEGGTLLVTEDGSAQLRIWTTAFNEDLYAPARRGRAYRFSHQRIAQRVLLASGQRLGLLTNGVQLLVLVSDPARPDSTITIPLDPGWKGSREVPDSFRFLLAIASPAGVQALPELVDKARLQQARVTKELRLQARQAVERFVQEVLDHPDNRDKLAEHADREALARQLWREGLITVYRLLFILKLEASDDPARSFSFASTSLWRNMFSPSMALARYTQDCLEHGAETGQLLESGLRSLFRMFEQGLECTELVVKPMGGALFGPHATPILSQLAWGERAVAWLLDRLLWTAKRRGAETRERVHYGPLDVEDLGRVYEALLELEPGITTQPMCRLRRQKLEVVVPIAPGERYRPARPSDPGSLETADDADEEADDTDREESLVRGKKTKVEWIEAIPPGRFYLRVGLGRKGSGSYYTPHSLVRFLVQETLGPQSAERNPPDNPQPLALLELKVLDPAMGSGHFLVEACRFLGEKLYEACRLCDERALDVERKAEKHSGDEQDRLLAQAREWRDRVVALPDPDDELLRYLPSRSPEGQESGLSQVRAEALCRRLVATHCLYGVDKNPLAVELAKLALWLESHAEGMPLTFLDHRLVIGDSLTGPFWDRLLFRPGNPSKPIEGLFSQGLSVKFEQALSEAIRYVRDLDAGVGATVAEIERKRQTKADLDRALVPFRIAAAAWSGGVMLGPEHCDDQAYTELLQAIAQQGDVPPRIDSDRLRAMIARGLGLETVPADRAGLYAAVDSGGCDPALSYDLTFPEVFYPTGVPHGRQGFHAVLGNPPWDQLQISEPDFWSSFDLMMKKTREIVDRSELIEELRAYPEAMSAWDKYTREYDALSGATAELYTDQTIEIDGNRTVGKPDLARLFSERFVHLTSRDSFVGFVTAHGFHANEGTSGIRRLFVERMQLRSLFSFENRKKYFEIDSRFKFDLVVASNVRQASPFQSRFYLQDAEWLFQSPRRPPALCYDVAFIQATGGPNWTLVECRDQSQIDLLTPIYRTSKATVGETFSADNMDISIGIEIHRNRAMVAENGDNQLVPSLPLLEGKHFWQHEPFTGEPVSFYARVDMLLLKSHWQRSVGHYRLAIRCITGATNERTLVCCVVPPGLAFNHSVLIEKRPLERPNVRILRFVAWANSYVADWLVRMRVSTNISKFLIIAGALRRCYEV